MTRRRVTGRAKYGQVYDGELFAVSMRDHLERCCDCGLVHRVSYYVVDKDGNRIAGARVMIRAWRDDVRTAAGRRGYKFVRSEDE